MSSWRGLLCALAGDFLALFLFASPVGAQTLQPVVVEYREKARGKFEIINDTLFPLNVVLEPKSFSISVEGHPSFRPLDEDVVCSGTRMDDVEFGGGWHSRVLRAEGIFIV